MIRKNILNFIPYSVSANSDYKSVIEQIDNNKHGFVCVLDKKNHIIGVITDGDIRRKSLVSDKQINLLSAEDLMNSDFHCFVCENDNIDINDNNISHEFLFIPVTDSNKILKSIIINDWKGRLNPWLNSTGTFIIAEIGNNHQGSFQSALNLVKLAKWSGADCVKFQHRNLNALCRSGNLSDEDLGTEYTLDLLKKFSLSKQDLFKVFDYAFELGIIPLCTPFDNMALEDLEEYGKLSSYKIASADLTNHQLIINAIKTGKSLIVSTGMATNDEIKSTAQLLDRYSAEYALLHCNSTYPAPYKDLNLKYLNKLLNLSSSKVVGYSGHERGCHIPVAAVAMGCKIIEKHMTTDKNLEGNDHKVSLLPDEFKLMVDNIRDLELALVHSENRIISQGELINRENLAKSIVVNQDLEPGMFFSLSNLSVKSPGKGLPPYKLNEVISKPVLRSLKSGDFIYESDIDNNYHDSKEYNFDFAFGIPIRFHDYLKMKDKSNFDLFEFHFSYNDLSVNIDHYPKSDKRLVVHAPELFEGDHVLNLASDSKDYRDLSVKHLQRVVEKTIELRKYFHCPNPTPIIVNCGGFSEDDFISQGKNKLYDRVAKCLNSLKNDEIEFIPQTMPPFPWHFGGQRYHNLFCEPDEILDFYNAHGYSICLDISHTWLFCNFKSISFDKSMNTLKNIVRHIHIADSSGVDGEGLQINEGIIDFSAFSKIYKKNFPDSTWIPEIWQGHTNEGEGFWIALSKLEKMFQ